jgi:hypothetical protein
MKRIDWRAICSHNNYLIKEVASTLKIAERTVGRWISAGLPTVDNRRPILIAGRDLRLFLQQRSRRLKKRCPSGHLYCVCCKVPKIPFGHFVDWLPNSSGTGLLRGLCETCGNLIHRGANISSVSEFRRITRGLKVTSPRAQPRLNGCSYPLVNVVLEGGEDASN